MFLVLLEQSLSDIFQETNPGDQEINSWRQALFPLSSSPALQRKLPGLILTHPENDRKINYAPPYFTFTAHVSSFYSCEAFISRVLLIVLLR